jgi:hypothetical protein
MAFAMSSFITLAETLSADRSSPSEMGDDQRGELRGGARRGCEGNLKGRDTGVEAKLTVGSVG